MLSGRDDGPAGLKAVIAAGGVALAEGGLVAPDAAGHEFVCHRGGTAEPVDLADLPAILLGHCGR